MDPKDMEINALNAQITALCDKIATLSGALYAITTVAGNLSDERVEAIGGINDGRSRANMVITARELAHTALIDTGYAVKPVK